MTYQVRRHTHKRRENWPALNGKSSSVGKATSGLFAFVSCSSFLLCPPVCLQLWAWAKGWWAWQWPGAKLPVAMSPESLIKSLSILHSWFISYEPETPKKRSEASQDLEGCCKHRSWPCPWFVAERHLGLLLPAPLHCTVLAQTRCLISEIMVIKKKINDHLRGFLWRKASQDILHLE